MIFFELTISVKDKEGAFPGERMRRMAPFLASFALLFSLCNAYAQNPDISVKFFLDMLKKREEVKTILGPPLPRKFFSQLTNLENNSQKIEISPSLLSWASGGKYPRNFKNESLNIYFQKLFLLIQKSFPDIELSRVNLFHGHLVKSANDFFIVFHAFEYPIDLEPQKFELAKRLDPAIKPFTTNLENYKWRNLIWSLRENKIWRFDTSLKSKFNAFVRSPAFDLYPNEVLKANALQEQLLGKNIADLNYFPREYSNLIMFLR